MQPVLLPYLAPKKIVVHFDTPRASSDGRLASGAGPRPAARPRPRTERHRPRPPAPDCIGNYIRDCPRTRLGRNSRILSFGNSSEHTGIPPAFPLAGRLHSHTAVRCGLGIASGIAVHSRGWHGRGAERTARSNSVRAPAFRQPPQCRPASSTSADGRPCPGPCVASAPPCPRSGCCAARRTRRGSAAGAARSCDGRFRSSRA